MTQYAFPHINPNYDGNWDKEPQRNGMTLRDWFAGQALSGMMAYQNEVSGDFHNNCTDVGAAAYRYADAMLAARNNTNTNSK